MKEKIRQWIFYPESPFRLAVVLSLPLIIVLGLLVVNMIKWEQKSLEDIQITNMKEFAKAFFSHIVATNIWTKKHGGVYVEITQHPGQPKRQQPVSIMGKDFVKITPRIITQQIASLLEKRSVYRFHVTSLQPTSPEGKPDRWEAAALLDFREGAVEATTIMEINSKRYFRYMAPLPLDETCLKCHEKWGPKTADIRGGLSIDIPLETTDRLFAVQVKRSSLSYATFGIITIISIMILTWYFSKRISDAFKEKTRQQKILKNLNDQLSLLSARDKKILASIVDGIVILNEEGVIEHINDAFSQFTGITPEDIQGRTISEFSDHPILKDVFNPAQLGEITIDSRIFIVSEVPVINEEEGKLLCTLRIIHDATNEKLSAAMELAGAAAHEVRQPLAIFLSMLEMVREKQKKGQDISDELKIFEQQCKRINDIISRMLNITRYQTKQYTDDTKIFDL